MTEQRGRKSRGPYGQKAEILSTRIRSDTKTALIAAADENGRSLSQEIEHRLRRSFDEDAGLYERLGGRRNYAVLRLLATIMEKVQNPFDPGKDWLDDPYKFDQFLKVVNQVLEAIRPPGDRLLPTDNEDMRAIGDLQSTEIVVGALLGLKDASPDLALDPKDRVRRLLRSDLGAVADRIGNRPGYRIAMGTADDLRRVADEMRREEEGR